VHLESTAKNSGIKEWHDLGFNTTERSAATFAKGLMRNLGKELEHTMPNDALERWLHVTPQFLQIWREVFSQLYCRHGGSKRNIIKEMEIPILPALCGRTKKIFKFIKIVYNFFPIFQMLRKIVIIAQSSNYLTSCISMLSCPANIGTNGAFYSHRKSTGKASRRCWEKCWTKDQRCSLLRTRINIYLAATRPKRGP